MRLRKLKILVTGGAGFIGSHLIERLAEMDNDVAAYDDFDKYYVNKERNLQNVAYDHFTLINADILDYDTLRNATKGSDIVFHLAAQPGVRFSMENPMKTSKVNIVGTLNVLRAAKEASVGKVLFASSSSVYGQPKYMPVDESHATEPISIYGASKLAAEMYCQVFSKQFALPVVMLRYFTVYGPRQRPDMAIYKWTEAILKSKPLTIYGDGMQTRDFTYISDIIDGTIAAAEAEDLGGQIFNLGGSTRVSINDVIKMLIEILDVKNAQIVCEMSKLGDVPDTHADITKARKIIGFSPKVQLRKGLEQFVEWYKLVNMA